MGGFGDIKLRLANWLETYVTTHFPGLWERVMKYPELHRLVNALLIDRAIVKMPTRPNPLSTLRRLHVVGVADRPHVRQPPPPAGGRRRASRRRGRGRGLFTRAGDDTLCPKSTVMFAYFAQWFTDGFLRSDRRVERDPRPQRLHARDRPAAALRASTPDVDRAAARRTRAGG